MSEDEIIDKLQDERDLLRRQVEVLAERIVRIAGICSKCPAIYACDTTHEDAWCEELIKAWSIEQAKKGGGGEC